jgi:hypothetical protein
MRTILGWAAFILGLAAVALIITAADRGWMATWFYRINQFPFGDKAGHFVLIGGLAFLLNYALKHRPTPWRPLGRRVLWGSLIVGVLITLEEISQIWIRSRTFSLGDLAANYAGIVCAQFLSPGGEKSNPNPTREADPA